MSKTPQATVSVGDAEDTRDVCSLTINTRGEDRNRMTLAGGVEMRVDDEFAETVAASFFNNADD